MSRLAAIILLTTLVLVVACSQDRCTKPDNGEPDPFLMKAYPDTIRDAAVTQDCVFLLEFSNPGEADSIYLSAEAIGGGMIGPSVRIPIRALEPEQIGEVEVSIHPFGKETDTISVVIEAQADDAVSADTCTIFVYEGQPHSEMKATEVLWQFLEWFEGHEPGLGIGYWTGWNGTIVVPHICCATHYLFFSEDWEMGLWWIIVPPPSDGVGIYLRHRYTEMAPSHAFRMDSWSERTEPYPVDPPDEVTR